MALQPADLSRGRAASLIGAAGLATFSAAIPGFLAGGAPYGDDNSSHFAEILYIGQLLKAGQSDFWFDQTNLGYPLFLAYQPAPSLLMGALVALTDSFLAPLFLFKLSIALLWGCVPVTWYLGGRWLGMRRLEALLFGLLILGVNDLYSFGLGLTSALANGLYSQTWGTLLLPLALGSTYQYLFGQRHRCGLPVLLLSLTLLCHAFLGLYAAVASALMLVVRREGLAARGLRFATVWSLVALATAFWLLPFLSNLEYQGGLPWKGASEDGYPLADLLRWLVTGGFFDSGRLPWLSALVVAGGVLAARRFGETRERWALLLFAVTFALLMGRTGWGAAYAWIPLHGEIEVIRYLAGLHFAGLVLASLAGARALDSLPRLTGGLSGPRWLTAERTRLAILVVLSIGYLFGLHLYARSLLQTFDVADPDFARIAAKLAESRESRFLCHEQLGTADHFHLNLLPALAGRPQLQSFARGYHDTLSLFYLEYFDFSPTAFRLYNVGAVVARGDEPPPPLPDSLEKTWSAGELAVYESAAAPGYFSFVRIPASVVADLQRARPLLLRLSLPLFEAGVLPRLSPNGSVPGPELRLLDGNRLTYSGDAASPARDVSVEEAFEELTAERVQSPGRSRVLSERVAANQYAAVVEVVDPREELLLKVSYHPYWRAAVDGEPLRIDLVAPNLMAVSLPTGRHEVVFRYRNPLYQKLSFGASFAALLVWGAWALLRTQAAGGRA